MFIIIVYLAGLLEVQSAGILYPRVSESRQILSLDGLWNFALTQATDLSKVHTENWYQVDLRSVENIELKTMPVPSSYNDIGVDVASRDHVGLVWYQRKFFVPKSWSGQRVWIRFSSVCRAADVWINGQSVLSHDIGHLPFQAEVSTEIRYGDENNITVAVDNRLLSHTIPQGSLKTLVSGRMRQLYSFDFFNYAGIDRPVVLYTTPTTYIDDITVNTDIDGVNGFVNYSISVQGDDQVTVKATLLDKTGKEIVSDTVLNGTLFVQDATFWWPYLMDPSPGYLYSLQVQLLDSSGALLDKYTLPVGIRTISWDSTSLKINNKSVYLRGFGRHEDSDIRGKGLDLPLIIRDYNLIKWIGANAYRTSHYPYAEEIMDLADELGIMIIDECPIVDAHGFLDELLVNHKKSLTELIQRDKNRPAVIMWSTANEASTQVAKAENYFKEVVAHVKSLDTSRPVTAVIAQTPERDRVGQFLDVINCNAYNAWYNQPGDLDVIDANVKSWVKRWHQKYNVTVIMSEYGADAQEGLHFLPAFIWSEEYQEELLSNHFKAFDELREEKALIGEMIWNFADFKTDQSYTRVGGNKKGIFTRSRQPKASAHLVRRRYWALAQHLDQAEVPRDLNEYVFGIPTTTRDEL